jgi:electron transfer flavoprotein beta subunit
MLPQVLDPWAAHSLYEAAHLARKFEGSRVWLVSLGPRARLQQLMMTIAQKVPFDLVAADGSAGGFTDARETARALAESIKAIPDLDRERMLLFGGCASASRDAGVTLQMVGERLGLTEQFLAVDELAVQDDGSFRIAERIGGGRYQVSRCDGPPAVLAWATGSLPEPPNNPQVGMKNMQKIMPALQRTRSVSVAAEGVRFLKVELPEQRRETRIVKEATVEEMAKDIVAWIEG